MKYKRFQLHKEYLPFVGTNYDTERILLVGESHYINEEDKKQEELEGDFSNWYISKTEENQYALKYAGWFTTRNVIENFQCRNRSRSFTMFSYPAGVIKDLLGSNCPTDSAAFSFVSFCNYFQRPSLKKGSSFNTIIPDEASITAEIFEQIIDVMEPQAVIFLSKKSYDSFMHYKNKDYDFLIDFAYHPTSHWWYDALGKEKFTNIMSKYFSEKSLKVKLIDERKWLMQELFDDFEHALLKHGVNINKCSVEIIEEYYEDNKVTIRPYIEISKNQQTVRLEIDSRIYIYKPDGKWEYLPKGKQVWKDSVDGKDIVPNFRRFNFSYRELFRNDSRNLFVQKSVELICKAFELPA